MTTKHPFEYMDLTGLALIIGFLTLIGLGHDNQLLQALLGIASAHFALKAYKIKKTPKPTQT